MPDRYWVGGTGDWNGTAGTKWSATPGGAGGASVPTTADDVFFDVASGAGTVTIAAGNLGARSINCTGFTGTISTGAAITVAGSITLSAAMTLAGSRDNAVTITGSGTLTTAGKTFNRIVINGAGIIVGLGDPLAVGGGIFNSSITLTSGTFNTNNHNIVCNGTNGSAGISITGTLAKAMNLGSSTVTIAASGGEGTSAFNANITNLTFNAGTSTLIFTGFTDFFGAGLVYHNVSLVPSSAAATVINITGQNTFNNLVIGGPGVPGIRQVVPTVMQTVNGTLSTTNTAGNRRVWFRSPNYGINQPLLTVNGNTTGLTDADFRDVIVTGTAAPISGTRIGDLRGNRGITFSAPKTVFRIGTGNWSDNQWAAISGGAVSTDNFPLAQDTAVFNNSTTAGTHTFDTAITYFGTIDMSARTNALTISLSTPFTVYGNWLNGSGISLSDTQTLTFSGRNTQTITSAGIVFPCTIAVDTYGGTVTIADPLSIDPGGGAVVWVINGTFDTGGFNVTAFGFFSSNANVRSILLRSSTVTLSATPFTFSTATNLTFDAGTSTIIITSDGVTFDGASLVYNNVTCTSTGTGSFSFTGTNTFNNLTLTPPTSNLPRNVFFGNNQTVTGTLTVSGGSVLRRLVVQSGTTGTPVVLTVNTLAATDCDFRDITIAGAAAGSSPTRAGNCGGNSGITFPAPKTVFWNLAGTQNWSATGWATTSGGTPAVNNFPLAQDTAVFDNTGAAGTVTVERLWNIGTVNMVSRTTSMTLAYGGNIHGNFTLGTGVTTSSGGATFTFRGRGTSTITSNGRSFTGQRLLIDCITGTVQLADPLTFGAGDPLLALTSGTFDAVTHNVNIGTYNGAASAAARTLRMGTGTWTLFGTGTVWNQNSTTNFTLNKGTANIILSDTSTTARTFEGGGLAYNRLTIGGATGTSTTTITGNNSFTELASTKTVAHTIALGSTAQSFGAWTVTGTVGNVVTLTGTGTSHSISGAATSGIDYLAMGSIGFAGNSPGEFYAGANSTGTAGAPVFRTAPPAPRTLYWVGGTGNWGDTARWSTAPGGAGGAAIPTSLDNVIFNSASNATAYTATLNVVARCNQLTIAGPASGNLTLASSATSNSLIVHGNTVFPATGFTRTFSSAIVLSGSTTGKTFASNGVSFQGLGSGVMVLDGVGAGWSMSDTLNLGNNDTLRLLNGTLSTNNFPLTVASIDVQSGGGSKTLNLGSSVVTMGGSTTPIRFGSTNTIRDLFTFNPGTSTINISVSSLTFTGNGMTFYDVSLSTAVFNSTTTLNGANTFRNLTFGAAVDTGIQTINVNANQTVNGTLAFTAGANATRRNFIRSTSVGSTITITAAAFSGTDVDFRDIAITGAAAPVSGTRLGDCKGNSGITFPAGVNKFWNLAGGGNWSSTAWATISGGTPAVNNFPLAQDTCVFQSTGLNSGATVTIDFAFNIGTIDMSARTTNTMTLATTTSLDIHGNWINGTGTTLSGATNLQFVGRVSQTITSATRPFTQSFTINSPSGAVTSVVLLDALTLPSITIAASGSLVTNSFAVNLSGFFLAGASAFGSLSMGTSTITLSVDGGAWSVTQSLFTVTGSGTISLTSASAKTFNGGGANYSGITLNQGGAGELTITGNNRFRDITATQTSTSAATISLGTTTQTLTQFTGKGEAGRILTFQGTSAASPATIVYTGFGPATTSVVDRLNIIGIRAYPLINTWYAGNNSTNGGTLGWIFEQTPAILPGNGNFFLMFI